MCNPRRVCITETRELEASWRREVARSVRRSGAALGEARMVRRLDESLSPRVLRALDQALADGLAGWQALDGGYRHALEGGYLHYDPEQGALEIVAVAQQTLEVEGRAATLLQGEVRETLDAEAEGNYYDDNWGGHTREKAEAEAREKARGKLDRVAEERLNQAADEAEALAAEELETRAGEDARQQLAVQAETHRAALEQQAAARLEQLGVRARAVFNRALAGAYRGAILAYARAQGAAIATDREQDGVLELEFTINR